MTNHDTAQSADYQLTDTVAAGLLQVGDHVSTSREADPRTVVEIEGVRVTSRYVRVFYTSDGQYVHLDWDLSRSVRLATKLPDEVNQ